jgi:hypothetical protein
MRVSIYGVVFVQVQVMENGTNNNKKDKRWNMEEKDES